MSTVWQPDGINSNLDMDFFHCFFTASLNTPRTKRKKKKQKKKLKQNKTMAALTEPHTCPPQMWWSPPASLVQQSNLLYSARRNNNPSEALQLNVNLFKISLSPVWRSIIPEHKLSHVVTANRVQSHAVAITLFCDAHRKDGGWGVSIFFCHL